MFNPFAVGNPAGFGQNTLVGRVTIAGASSAPMRKARRGKKKGAAASRGRRKVGSRRAARVGIKRGSRRKARLVKGSPAARAYMRKIRGMRKRK